MMPAINPEDFGAGKEVTGAMAVQYLEQNYHKIILALILRNGVSTVIDAADVQRLLQLPDGTGLGVITAEDGVHLFALGPGLAKYLPNAHTKDPQQW